MTLKEMLESFDDDEMNKIVKKYYKWLYILNSCIDNEKSIHSRKGLKIRPKILFVYNFTKKVKNYWTNRLKCIRIINIIK